MTNRLKTIAGIKKRRSIRVRSQVQGTAERPRLHVSISNQHISAQIIDDENNVTIASASTIGKKEADKKSMTEKATWVGELIAKNAKAKKVSTVVFDRGPKLYHGRVKALAETARKSGLEF